MHTYAPFPPVPGADAAEGGPRLLPRVLVLLAVILGAVWFVPSSGVVICAGLAVYAVRGPKQAIQALTLLAFMLLLGAKGLSLARWVVLFSACGRMVWDSVMLGAPTPRVLKPILLFTLIVLVFSFSESRFPLVSILKGVTFAVGAGTVVVALHRTAHLREYWMAWFFTLGLFILLASFPLYGTQLGYSRNGVGFQGILSHPQTYGPVVAPFAALLTGLFVFHGVRSWPVLLGSVLAWAGAYTSGARTAILAALVGLGITLVVGRFKGRTWQPVIAHALSRSGTLALLFIACLFAAVQWSTLQEKAMAFLLKDDGVTVTESLVESRSEPIERSMANFWESPLTGIGFGVPSDLGAFRAEVGAFGLPVSASTEKGFMPSAVLEETGIVGAGLILVLLFVLIQPVVRYGSIPLFWMLMTCLMVNVGEMFFFALGASGLYLWLIMGFCHVHAAVGAPPAGGRAPAFSPPRAVMPVRPGRRPRIAGTGAPGTGAAGLRGGR